MRKLPSLAKLKEAAEKDPTGRLKRQIALSIHVATCATITIFALYYYAIWSVVALFLPVWDPNLAITFLLSAAHLVYSVHKKQNKEALT